MATGFAIETPPIVPNGDVLYEVVCGQIRELPPMGAFEVSLANYLNAILDAFAQGKELGRSYVEMLFLLDAAANLQRRPDVALVLYQRWPKGKRVPSTNAWPIVPNLAAEVVSPSNTWNEIIEKIADYFRNGVQLVWVVSPVTEQVYVYTAPNANRILNKDGTLDGCDVLPGFALPLVQLFGDEVN